jgi:hypothetical protein
MRQRCGKTLAAIGGGSPNASVSAFIDPQAFGLSRKWITLVVRKGRLHQPIADFIPQCGIIGR